MWDSRMENNYYWYIFFVWMQEAEEISYVSNIGPEAERCGFRLL